MSYLLRSRGNYFSPDGVDQTPFSMVKLVFLIIERTSNSIIFILSTKKLLNDFKDTWETHCELFGYVCAMGGFRNGEENCFDFP